MNPTGREYLTFLRRHGLTTWVRIAHLRHWVEYRAEKARVPVVHLAYMRGHAVKSATEGRLGYSGNRRVETVLEDQEAVWPDGPCGVFGVPAVIESGIPPEVARLIMDFMAGKVDGTTFALKMADARMRVSNVIGAV